MIPDAAEAAPTADPAGAAPDPVAEAAAMNRMRWQPGQHGHYEGWYVAFNDPEGGRGWWIRYSMLAPSSARRPPVCQIWFMRTDRAREARNRAVRATLPATTLHHEPGIGGFTLELGGGLDDAAWGWIDASGCAGRVRDGNGDVRWDLRFEALLPPIAPTPEWGARFATCYLEPHPLLRVRGVITEGRTEREVEGLLGQQAHVFGVRHSARWHWAECKHLGSEGGSFVGVSSWLPVGLPVTSLYLARGDRTPLLRNTFPDLVKPRTRHDPAGWRFTAGYGTERVIGAVTPRSEDLIGVTYHDPSGQKVFCYHSELADLRLEVQTRQGRAWRTEEVIEAPGASAFEYGSHHRLSGVELLLD